MTQLRLYLLAKRNSLLETNVNKNLLEISGYPLSSFYYDPPPYPPPFNGIFPGVTPSLLIRPPTIKHKKEYLSRTNSFSS